MNLKQNFLSCDVIQSLQDYMLNENVMTKSLENISMSDMDNVIKNRKTDCKPHAQCSFQNNKNNFFIPRQKDSLFWCFYIMKYGDVNYELLGKITPIIEKKQKIEYVEKIRKEKLLLKPYKFSSLTNIENKLANECKIDLNTFLTLCVVENLNVIYIHKRTYYELLMNNSSDIFIIHSFEHDKFGCKMSSINDSEIEKYKSSLFKIENVEKPIKSLSSYKVQELIDYCVKLDIAIINKENGKTKLKKELYESLIQYF